jgi:Leucine-rich repeat (LRR) protein
MTDYAPLIGTREPETVVKLRVAGASSLPEMSRFVKLRDLNLYGNDIAKLPPSLWQLPCLEKLDLGKLRVAELPADIGKLRKLKHLRIDDTAIATLPATLWSLDLTELRMSGTRLTSLPVGIAKLARLTLLWIDRTEIATLPPELGTLRKLSRFRVSRGVGGLDAFRAARPTCLVQVMG